MSENNPLKMLPASLTSARMVHANDVVCTFASNSDGLVISVGKAQSDCDPAGTPQIQWYIGEEAQKPGTEALQDGTIYVLNREVFVGNVALVREVKKGGLVIGTQHKLIGSVEKVEPDGTRRKYIVSDIAVERLEKIFPFQIGNHIYSRGWIGKVENVHMQLQWTFDRPTNTAAATLPIGMIEEFKLKKGETVDMLPHQIREKCVFKTKSWYPFTRNKFQNKPATLVEMDQIKLEVCWIERLNQSVSPEKPSRVVAADSSVKVFHLCKDDWEYFGAQESFRMNWELDDHDKTQPYWHWESQMCFSLLSSEFEDSPTKRFKVDPIFEIGDGVVVTPVALQTTAVIAFPNGQTVINHAMKASDIPELGREVRPRELPSNPMEFQNMDLVFDELESSTIRKYGFVLNPSGEDGTVLIKWIYNLGDNDTLVKVEWVDKRNLVLHPFQSELNPKEQEKIAVAVDGNLGTLKGMNSSNCKAVMRLVGTFDEKEYWPHELKFLKE